MSCCAPATCIPACSSPVCYPVGGLGSLSSCGLGSSGMASYGGSAGGSISAASLGIAPGASVSCVNQTPPSEIMVQPSPFVVVLPGAILGATSEPVRVGGYTACASGSSSGGGSRLRYFPCNPCGPCKHSFIFLEMSCCAPATCIPACSSPVCYPVGGLGSLSSCGLGSSGMASYGGSAGGSISAASLGIAPGASVGCVNQTPPSEIMVQPSPFVVVLPGAILGATSEPVRVGGYTACASGSSSGGGSRLRYFPCIPCNPCRM
ncbi:hypothetical protein E2320_014022 [Naja naja]|nr:hypothetical protein E2320_014022 [Naja naja]